VLQIAILQQAILPKLQTNSQWERMPCFIQLLGEDPKRGVHHLVKEGAPLGRENQPSVGEWAATSPYTTTTRHL